MIELRVHYHTRHGPRCGHREARNGTINPKKVTCLNCIKLMKGKVK